MLSGLRHQGLRGYLPRMKPPALKVTPSSWNEICSCPHGQAKTHLEQLYGGDKDWAVWLEWLCLFRGVQVRLSNLRTRHQPSGTVVAACCGVGRWNNKVFQLHFTRHKQRQRSGLSRGSTHEGLQGACTVRLSCWKRLQDNKNQACQIEEIRKLEIDAQLTETRWNSMLKCRLVCLHLEITYWRYF